MKLFRKLNKGLMLTILVVGVLAIYLFAIESKRNAAKPEIEKVVKEYIELTNKYAVLPEDMQKLYNGFTMTEEDLNKIDKENEDKLKNYLNKYEEELKTKMIDNETVVNMQKEIVEEFLKNSNNYLQTVVTKYNKEITKIRKYSFDDDQVTVTFDTKSDIENKYLDDGNEKTRKDTTSENGETITLQLVDGNWKVVYSDIMYHNIADTKGMVQVNF